MEFRILGPLEVLEEGRKLPLGGAKQRALLALLLLHANRLVSRDRLIDELWDTDPPETARTALQVHVSQLRKTLGRDRIVTQAPGYLVRIEPGELDLERFEQLTTGLDRSDSARAAQALRQALGLWRGPPLGDLDDTFARAERARLEEQRELALEQRIEAELALGLHAELVPELEALVRENPLRERLRAQLMLALYRSGRQADALEVYRHGRQLLADELGLEPGEELRRLESAILQQDPSLKARAEVDAVAGRLSEHRRLRLVAVAAGGLLLIAAVATGIVLATRDSVAVPVRANSVAALDVKTGKVVADVPIGGRPIAIALGAGSAWVADADNSTVSRIDAKTYERVPIGGLGSDVHDIAFGFRKLWVAGGNEGTLWRVDPRTNGARRVDLGSAHETLPQPVFAVRVGAGAIWAIRGKELLRIDPAGARVTLRRPIPVTLGLAAGLGSVWLTTEDERVVRIDARTLKTLYAHELTQSGFFPIVAVRSLWLVGSPGLTGDLTRVWRFDPGTLAQDATISLPKVPAYGLAAGGGSLWTVDVDTGGVWRIDPRTNSPSRLANVGHHPVAIAAGARLAWVGVQNVLP